MYPPYIYTMHLKYCRDEGCLKAEMGQPRASTYIWCTHSWMWEKPPVRRNDHISKDQGQKRDEFWWVIFTVNWFFILTFDKTICWRSSYTWPFYFNPACQIVYFSRGRAGWKIKEQLWNLHFCYWERRYSIKLRAVLCADFLLGWFSSDLLESTTLPLCWGVVLPWEVKPSKT